MKGAPIFTFEILVFEGVHVYINVMGTIHEIFPLSRAEIHLFFSFVLRLEGSKKQKENGTKHSEDDPLR